MTRPSRMAPPVILAPYVAPVKGQIILMDRTDYGDAGFEDDTFIESIGGNTANSVALEYLNQGQWGGWPGTTTTDVFTATGGWTDFLLWPGQKCVAIPLQVAGPTTLSPDPTLPGGPLLWTDILSGAVDSYWNSFFTYCKSNGIRIFRPGWEFNGNWYPWGLLGNETNSNMANFCAVWIYLWNLANAIAPGYFIWWWNLTALPFTNDVNFVPGGPCYPGDKYVDGIGFDLYNNANGYGSFPGDNVMQSNLVSGNQPNWTTMVNYAASHNKSLVIPEWGLNGGSAPSNGDDTAFIQYTWNLFLAAATTYNLQVYVGPWNNEGRNPISGYPASLALLTSLVKTAVNNKIINSPVIPLKITAVGPQSARVGQSFTLQLTSTGGLGAITWSAPTLPGGLSISSSGKITGDPTVSQLNTVVNVEAQDSNGDLTSTSFLFSASNSALPQFPPPGGVGALLLDTDFSIQATNGPIDFSLFPEWAYWFNNTGSMNAAQLAAKNVAIVNGQLVLTIPNDGTGGCICTDSRMGQANPFEHTYFYVEFDIIIPPIGWWACWSVTPVDPYGENDFAENLSTGSVSTNIHWGSGDSNAYNGGQWPNNPALGSHAIVGGIWQPGNVTSYLSGVPQKSISNNQGGSGVPIGSTNQGIILNIGGAGSGQLKVNSVKVWALAS